MEDFNNINGYFNRAKIVFLNIFLNPKNLERKQHL